MQALRLVTVLDDASRLGTVAHLRIVKISEIIIQNQMVYLVWFSISSFIARHGRICLSAAFYCLRVLFTTDKWNEIIVNTVKI